jgi:hypothetical protein
MTPTETQIKHVIALPEARKARLAAEFQADVNWG